MQYTCDISGYLKKINYFGGQHHSVMWYANACSAFTFWLKFGKSRPRNDVVEWVVKLYSVTASCDQVVLSYIIGVFLHVTLLRGEWLMTYNSTPFTAFSDVWPPMFNVSVDRQLSTCCRIRKNVSLCSGHHAVIFTAWYVKTRVTPIERSHFVGGKLSGYRSHVESFVRQRRCAAGRQLISGSGKAATHGQEDGV